MAGDDGAPGVEFVTGRGDDSTDEDLPAAPRAPRRNPRWTLAGGAVVLAGAALVARAVSHGNEPGSPAPSNQTPTSSAASAAPGPGLAAPQSDRPVLDPRRIKFGAVLCQRPASCSLSVRLPAGTVDALFGAFPGVRVRSSSTVLSTRADKMAPDVVTRHIIATAGTTAISVLIAMRVPIDGPAVEQHRGATSMTTVRAIELGYLITIRTTRPGTPVAVTTVQRLATDGRLVLPQ